MDVKGTISAVGNVLCSAHLNSGVQGGEELAQKRFFSKLERPDSSKLSERRIAAWEEWLESDQSIEHTGLFRPNWARAKIFIASVLKDFSLGSVSFTNGSEFVPTRGRNSIESKLSRSEWTCTPDNLDLWCRTVYGHRGLKMAMRKRFAILLAKRGIDARKLNRFLWLRYRKYPDCNKRIFNFKVSYVTSLVHGNRFSTVPKNNLVDRPICVEPVANILTQRRVGLGIRASLQKIGVDLNVTAMLHRDVISIPRYATIDLKNASDRISIRLVKYLLPSRVYQVIEQSRSEMTLGLDDQFYLINKISSMGNGFTFELMSLILYALCRSHTSDCSVFGDDIVVPNDVAPEVIKDLENGGFVVNMKKTHINDTYRESCGAHFIDGEGYIESYDFRYPKSIGDVITTVNKLSRLALLYPSFRSLYSEVYRVVPAALFAENPTKASGDWHQRQEPFDSPKVDMYIVKSPFQTRKDGLPWTKSARRKLYASCKALQLDPRGASLHYGFEWKDSARVASDVNPRTQWAKILMYLASGRRCGDTIKGKGVYKSYLCVTLKDGTTFRWSALVAPR